MYSTITARQGSRPTDTLGPRVAIAHDNEMADGDRFIVPVTDSDATFWERWAALRYVEDQLPERSRLERSLLRSFTRSWSPRCGSGSGCKPIA